MKKLLPHDRTELLGFFVILIALLLRISWFGPEYYPQLDDYIHYRNLADGTNPVILCLENGLFASRPLAALQDFVFWGRIPLYLGSVILCAMYAAAGVLFWRLFRRYFNTGFVFLVVFALLPLGFEGTYWQAAATRILPPMLFAALAVTELDRFVQTKKYLSLVLFLIWSLLSFCFYEQILVLSLALSLMLVLVFLLERKWHGLWGLSVLGCVGIYFAATGYLGSLAQGQLSARMNVILPTDPSYFTKHLPRLFDQLKACFLDGAAQILGKGTLRGASLIFTEGIWMTIGILILAIGIYFAARKCPKLSRSRLYHLTPLFACLAALAPVTPFFIIENPWVCLRSTVPSFLGIALLTDYLVRLLLRNQTATAIAAAILTAVFMTSSVSELWDYRFVSQTNETVAQAILEADEALSLRGQVGILGLNQSYAPEQNYRYHDHIMSAHASGWALTGLVRYYDGRSSIPYVPVPLAVDEAHYSNLWSRDTKDVGRFDVLLLYDHDCGTLETVSARSLGDGEYLIYDENDLLRARTWLDEKGYGNIEFFEFP